MTQCGHIDLTRLAASLHPSRLPDIAAGLLLAAELVAELPSVPDGFGRLAWIALHDAAATLHADGEDPVTNMNRLPDGQDGAEDRPCETCTGQSAEVIAALGRDLRRARARHRAAVTAT